MGAIKNSSPAIQKNGLKTIIRNKWLWAAFMVIILAGGGFAVYRVMAKPAVQEVTTAETQTAVARQGELTVFASGVGEVVTAAEISVGFDESGTLSELLVKVGDEVEPGQLLARLETDQSEVDIALALAQAQLNVLEAQQNLDALYDNWQMDAAEALLAVEETEQALSDLQNNALAEAEARQSVAEAEEAVRTAQSSYNGVISTADQNTIAKAYAELVLAQKELTEQEEKFDDYYKKPDNDLEKASQQLKLSQAQTAYDEALRWYNAVTGTGSDLDRELAAAELATAQANLADAQETLDKLLNGGSPGEVALAEAELALAQATYATMQAGPDPQEIALAEAELANAEAELALAQEDQAIEELLAPMAGTVMKVNASVGESVSAGALIVLADLSQPVLEIYLDETDLNQIGVGYEVDVVFDAIPDSTYTGYVTEVHPSLQSSGGANMVTAKVQLASDSFAKPQTLPVGAAAAVDVIGGRTENAVLIPVEALRELGEDEYAVFVMENNVPKLRVVTVGLMDYTSAEITSGLEAGEVVTTGVVETQ